MANAQEISAYLDRLLKSDQYKDASQNGLQVEANKGKIAKVGVAVDSGLSIILKAIRLKCRLLVVHHGLFWNRPVMINGILGEKIRLLMENGCSLYAAHLPLDGDLRFGNAALLAKFLKMAVTGPFCKYDGSYVGVKARSAKTLSLDSVASVCKQITGAIEPLVLPFGKKEIKNVGIVTGSGSFALEACAEEGLDLLISGEAKQESYHLAKELGMNAIFAGHYATETFGVRALGKELEKKFHLRYEFIDESTGI